MTIKLEVKHPRVVLRVEGVNAIQLVLAMTHPWFVQERDGRGINNFPEIHHTSFQQANLVIPWTYVGYDKWASLQLKEPMDTLRKKLFPDDLMALHFDEARDFIKECAVHGYDAMLYN